MPFIGSQGSELCDWLIKIKIVNWIDVISKGNLSDMSINTLVPRFLAPHKKNMAAEGRVSTLLDHLLYSFV